MSTFEERLRARVESLIAETMDDVASEARKAVTPKPAVKCDHKHHAGGHKPWPGEGPGFCWCGIPGCSACPEVVAARLRRESLEPANEDCSFWKAHKYHHTACCEIGRRGERQDLRLPGTQAGSSVYLRFDEAAFEQWFRKWFDREVRAHGGMKALLNRVR